MMKDLFGFWKYDGFPYILGGTIIEMNSSGYIQTKEYGPGHWFNPIKILPLKEGKELLNKLEELEYEYRNKNKELLETYKEKANLIAPWGKECGI